MKLVGEMMIFVGAIGLGTIIFGAVFWGLGFMLYTLWEEQDYPTFIGLLAGLFFLMLAVGLLIVGVKNTY